MIKVVSAGKTRPRWAMLAAIKGRENVHKGTRRWVVTRSKKEAVNIAEQAQKKLKDCPPRVFPLR